LPYEAASNSIEAFTAMASGSVEAPEVAGHDAYACSGQPDRPLPIMVIHGTADGTVNVLNSRQIITELMTLADLADDGQDNESVPDVPSATETSLLPQGSFETETYGPLSAPLAHRVTVAGLGHAWSGGDASAPYADPDDPDATEALWRFLAVQARSDTSAETR
jgi:poly(3-hydroxybutyrate) depolymerase